ncbi:MAG: hypothetical protein KF813_09065 [Trueperaceae bacterium]|nr:hypothetical protein [Trueperaceae bacterium]
MSGIGSLNETALHAALKSSVAPTGSSFEVDVDGYVIDIVAGDLLIEVQTRSLGKLKPKLGALLPSHRMRLVVPIAERRYLVKLGEDGSAGKRRLSPKRGALLSVCAELVAFPELLDHDNLELEILLTDQVEFRSLQPGKAWRRRGWVTVGRELLSVNSRRLLCRPGDLLALLPDALPDVFSTADLARVAGVPRRLAQQTAYCLRRLKLLETAGKSGNAVLYRAVH